MVRRRRVHRSMTTAGQPFLSRFVSTFLPVFLCMLMMAIVTFLHFATLLIAMMMTLLVLLLLTVMILTNRFLIIFEEILEEFQIFVFYYEISLKLLGNYFFEQTSRLAESV